MADHPGLSLEPFKLLGARQIDILHDQGAAEEFWICGESLLLEALAHPRCSLDVPLTAFAAAERFLASLQECSRCTFSVLFFDYSAAWTQLVSTEAGALRVLFAAHLEAAGVPVLRFSNWWDESAPQTAADGEVLDLLGHTDAPLHRAQTFQQCLLANKPAFVMISDSLVSLPVPSGLACALPVGELTAGLMVCCLLHGIDCCYMASLQMDAITAWGFMPSAERATRSVRQWFGPCCEGAKAMIQGLAAPSSAVTLVTLTPLLELLRSWRLAAGVCSTSAALASASASGNWQWLAEVWLLHLVLLRSMDLESRALCDLPMLGPVSNSCNGASTSKGQPAEADHLGEDSAEEGQGEARVVLATGGVVAAFVSAVCGQLAGPEVEPALAALLGPGSTLKAELADVVRAELPDTYDVRFFDQLLAVCVAEEQAGEGASLGLPTAVQQEWATACAALHQTPTTGAPPKDAVSSAPAAVLAAVCARLGCTAPGELPAWLQRLAAPAETFQTGVLSKAAVASGKELLSQGFVPAVLSQCGVDGQLHSKAAADAAGALPPSCLPLFSSPSPFRERYHWHSKIPLQPAFVTEAEDSAEYQARLLKQAHTMPLEELAQLKWVGKARYKVAQLLKQAGGQFVNADKVSELRTEARLLAVKGVQARIIRSEQLDARALERMINSLQGAKFSRSAGRGVYGQPGQATDTKVSTKAAAIKANNKEDQRLTRLQGQCLQWEELVDRDLFAWMSAMGSTLGDIVKVREKALKPIATFTDKDLEPELLQVALGTQLLVLYAAIADRQKGAKTSIRAGAPGVPAAVAPAAAKPSVLETTAPVADLGPITRELLVEVLLTVQRLRQMPAAQLLAPLPAAKESKEDKKESKDKDKEKDKEKDKKDKKDKDKEKDKKEKDSSAAAAAAPGVFLARFKLPQKRDRTTCALAAALATLEALGFSGVAAALKAEVLASAFPSGGGGSSADAPGSGSLTPAERKAAKEAAKEAKASSKASAKGGPGIKGGASSGGAADAVPVTGTAEDATAAMAAAVAKLKLTAMPLGVCPVRFQLQEMGHLLVRPVEGAKADQRVDGFRPDPWQVKLLDTVDAGSSCVISAPTSSGKTFISSYVMARVLAKDDVGRAVIVLPTKALVNQLAAQVQNDFGPGVYGVFTKDFRKRVDDARVLITVPACLEILFLSANRNGWVSTVRAVILDEVHCMNERSTGDLWERLMLVARCPILALSATIGNPEGFVGWLRRVKAMQWQQDAAAAATAAGTAVPSLPSRLPPNYQVELIVHTERFNDLHYHYHVPGADSVGPTAEAAHRPVWTSGDASGSDLDPRLVVPLHPLASIDLQALGSSEAVTGTVTAAPTKKVVVAAGAKNAGVAAAGTGGTEQLADLSLTPGEALRLFDTMLAEAHSMESSGDADSAAQAVQLVTALQQLDPVVCLGGGGTSAGGPLLSRPAAKAWAKRLLTQVAVWCAAGQACLTAMLRVQASLSGDLALRLASYEAVWGRSADSEAEVVGSEVVAGGAEPKDAGSPHGSVAQLEHLMPLLHTLKSRNMLPSLVFNFDRSGCETYAISLLGQLEKAEAFYRKRYAKQLGDMKEAQYQARVAQQAADRQSSKNKPDEEAAPASTPGGAPVVRLDGISFSLDEDEKKPDPSFTFLTHDKANSGELDETIEDLRSAMDDDERSQALLRALHRGIGVHHSGLHKRYRQAVEMLFRSKTLQVVIATGTLAYGIHMPCRTVVMAGDSLFLDALNFRQMSGRAGRRGLDPLGHVVFFHVPLHKAHRLRTAPLPRLRGQYLLGPTLALRLLSLDSQLQAGGVAVGGAGRAGARRAAMEKKGSEVPRPAEHLMSLIIHEGFLRDAMIGRQAASTLAAAGLEDPVRQQLLHTFCMSMRLLMDSRLVNPSGQPCGLAGLVTHLFWTEPANLVLARLLASGVLHELVTDTDKSLQERRETLMLCVAHLFMRQPMHPAHARTLKSHACGKSSSMVVLPPAPPAMTQLVQQYNTEVLESAVRCIVAYAKGLTSAVASDPTAAARQRSEDATLPLTATPHLAPLGASQGEAPLEGSALCRVLLSPSSKLRLNAAAASPFCCLTGKGDQFANVAELGVATKARIAIPVRAVPVLEVRNRHGQLQPLNSFALDYLKNGDRVALVRDNNMAEGLAWELLSQISSVLKAVCVSLDQLEEEDMGAGGGEEAGEEQQGELAKAFAELESTFSTSFSAFNAIRS